MPHTWEELKGEWSPIKRKLLISNGALAVVLYDRLTNAKLIKFDEEHKFLDELTDFFENKMDSKRRIAKAKLKLKELINIIPPYRELNTYLKHLGNIVCELLSFKAVIDILLNCYEHIDGPLFQHLKLEVLPLQISFYSHHCLNELFFHAIQRNMRGLLNYESIVLL